MPPDDFGKNPSLPASPSDGYTRRALLLESQAAKAEDNAMSYLRQSLNSSREVTQSQGIAAALLAAIPTFGGYLIGKSVGSSKIPQGVYKGLDDLAPTGAYAGGLAGTKIGQEASSGYLSALEKDKVEGKKVLDAMSDLERQRADRLTQQANTAEGKALDIEANIAMLPIELEQYRKQQDIAKTNQIEVQRTAREESDQSKVIKDPELLLILQKQKEAALTGNLKAFPVIPGEKLQNLSAAQLNSVTEQEAENRRLGTQIANMEGERYTPPSTDTKKKMESVLLTKSVGSRYIDKFSQIAQSNPNYLEMNISKVLPATEIGALQKDMELFAVQVRNAREAGVMTKDDYERYSSYLTITGLDSVKSVLGRLKELQEVTDLSAKATLMSAKAGRENISSYEELFGYTVPTKMQEILPTSNSWVGAKPMSEEEFIQKFLAQKAMKSGGR